ncbi:tryptophan synthase subunit alpha [Streptomyces microflavus]
MNREGHVRDVMTPSRLAASVTRHPVLGAFSVAGYPDVPRSAEAFLAFTRSGAGLLEVGVPAVDPWLDGPSISDAHEIALRAGDGIATAVETIRLVTAETDRPVFGMAYWDTVRQFGPERFVREIAAAGAAGCLIADVAGQSRARWAEAASKAGLATPFLVDRGAEHGESEAICRAATGFVYVPAAGGQRTGYSAQLDLQALDACVDVVRRAAPSTPVLTGIGVSTPMMAAAVVARCDVDGVVVGSPLVRALSDGGPEAAAALVAKFVASVSSVVPEGAA